MWKLLPIKNPPSTNSELDIQVILQREVEAPNQGHQLKK